MLTPCLGHYLKVSGTCWCNILGSYSQKKKKGEKKQWELLWTNEQQPACSQSEKHPKLLFILLNIQREMKVNKNLTYTFILKKGRKLWVFHCVQSNGFFGEIQHFGTFCKNILLLWCEFPSIMTPVWHISDFPMCRNLPRTFYFKTWRAEVVFLKTHKVKAKACRWAISFAIITERTSCCVCADTHHYNTITVLKLWCLMKSYWNIYNKPPIILMLPM